MVASVTSAKASSTSRGGKPTAALNITPARYRSFAAVLILLITAGRPCNGPNHKRKTSAPNPIMTSRAMAAAVLHHGTKPSQADSTNKVMSRNLSAMGSRNLPNTKNQKNHKTKKPSSPSESAASMN